MAPWVSVLVIMATTTSIKWRETFFCHLDSSKVVRLNHVSQHFLNVNLNFCTEVFKRFLASLCLTNNQELIKLKYLDERDGIILEIAKIFPDSAVTYWCLHTTYCLFDIAEYLACPSHRNKVSFTDFSLWPHLRVFQSRTCTIFALFKVS